MAQAITVLLVVVGVICIALGFVATETVWQEIAWGVFGTAAFTLAGVATLGRIAATLERMDHDQREWSKWDVKQRKGD